MTLWSAEIKELEILYTSVKGRFPELDKELGHLIKTNDENVVMLYSRRCLEIIITDPRQVKPVLNALFIYLLSIFKVLFLYCKLSMFLPKYNKIH